MGIEIWLCGGELVKATMSNVDESVGRAVDVHENWVGVCRVTSSAMHAPGRDAHEIVKRQNLDGKSAILSACHLSAVCSLLAAQV